MNIKKAKEQIKNAMTAYFTKDEFGAYRIPIERQRPVFLIGPPGIGKTAIMEQIASELGVGLVSYSMTHHTRQSALGLPFIVKEDFGGTEYEMSEYTMSEIIGSVHRLIRDTGVKEGILFLDEINCVSETLAPCMLQFLQYKVFGQHKVPDGWILVTAGNPPEYNKSVRDFDIVTWDRLKRIDVEPDYEAWREYAVKKGVHASVLTYLSAKKRDFYTVETTVDGKSFVTARGWDDLSEMIYLYEENGLKVDEDLIGQYLQNRRIARDFAIYYELFRKYRSDYQVDEILKGAVSENIINRAKNAPFDERVSLLGLLYDAVTADMRKVAEEEDCLKSLKSLLAGLRVKIADGEDAKSTLESMIKDTRAELVRSKKASGIGRAEERAAMMVTAALESLLTEVILAGKEGLNAFSVIKEAYGKRVAALSESAANTRAELNNIFTFFENSFGEGQEILLLVTELTAGYHAARFIGRYGCEKYFEHNSELKFNERRQEINARLAELDI